MSDVPRSLQKLSFNHSIGRTHSWLQYFGTKSFCLHFPPSIRVIVYSIISTSAQKGYEIIIRLQQWCYNPPVDHTPEYHVIISRLPQPPPSMREPCLHYSISAQNGCGKSSCWPWQHPGESPTYTKYSWKDQFDAFFNPKNDSETNATNK